MKTGNNKRALFINPSSHVEHVPHYGLALFSAILKKHGFRVRVADYHYSNAIDEPLAIIKSFNPDVIGISSYSSEFPVTNQVIDRIRKGFEEIPIVLGGAHASCYYEDLARDKRLDYIFVGEAEEMIVDLIRNAGREPTPVIVKSDTPPDVNKIPYPDYSVFYNINEMETYPLMSSRGCPYNCTFCAVGTVNSRRWRPRDVSSCMEELKTVAASFPNVKNVVIWDDNFTLDLARGKRLIKEYAETKLSYKIRPANVRADRIDQELLSLLKSVGCNEVQFGVESGDEEIFKSITKGETLEDIKKAVRLVKANDMRLFVSFIVGLPGDNMEISIRSIKFARQLKADVYYWNMLVAYKGTGVYRYFKEHGKVMDAKIPFTRIGGDFNETPNAESFDFPTSERKKAYKIAQIVTGAMSTKGNRIFLLINGVKYGFMDELWRLFLKKNFIKFIPKFLAHLLNLTE